MSKEQPQQQPRAPHLLARDFKHDALASRMVSFATVPVETSVQAIREPAFWANVARHLRVSQRIDVECVDGSWLAEFRVASVGSNWARVQLLRLHKFVTAESVVQRSKDFKIEWGGPSHKHRVVRVADKAILEKGFDTPEQAAEWLAANEDAMTSPE